MQPNAFDVLILVGVLLAARAGYRSGAGEALWSAARWCLATVLASLVAVYGGKALAATVSVPAMQRSYLLYFAVLILLMILFNMLERRIATPITNAIPPGILDHLLGGVMGITALAGTVLIAVTLVSPFDGGTVDWNPTNVRTDQAVGELGRAVMTSVRRFVVDESVAGRWVLTSFPDLQLPSA
ncbi:MAG: CvpA family protein [Verrucomicrobiales bacterium]|nr:CvpA family protein [Verrucomicrobiales bacterium]